MPPKLVSQPGSLYQNHRISTLGMRLRAVREKIEAGAARGETRLLNHEELERELEALRSNDQDLR
jgi:hypothetical protein